MMYYPPFLSILIVGVVSVVLGYIWYNMKVFGAMWKSDEGLTNEKMREGGTPRMILSLVGGLLSGMLIAFVMSYFLMAWGVYDIVGAVEVAIWLWVGFVAPVAISEYLFSMRPLRLFFIKGGYYLVFFIIAATTLITINPILESTTPISDMQTVESVE